MKRRIAPQFGALAQGALAVLLVLCLASPALAATKTRKHKKSTTLHRGAQGLRAYIDPATGKLGRPRATDANGVPETAAAARVAADDASRDVPVVRLANGTEAATLDERFQEYEVVRVGANGKLVRSCVQGPAAAEKARKAPVPPAKELQ